MQSVSSFPWELGNQLLLQFAHLKLELVLGGELLTSQACLGLLVGPPDWLAALSNIARFGIRSRLALVTPGSVATQLHAGFTAVGAKFALKSAERSTGFEVTGSLSPLVPALLFAAAAVRQVNVGDFEGRICLLKNTLGFRNWSGVRCLHAFNLARASLDDREFLMALDVFVAIRFD